MIRVNLLREDSNSSGGPLQGKPDEQEVKSQPEDKLHLSPWGVLLKLHLQEWNPQLVQQMTEEELVQYCQEQVKLARAEKKALVKAGWSEWEARSFVMREYIHPAPPPEEEEEQEEEDLASLDPFERGVKESLERLPVLEEGLALMREGVPDNAPEWKEWREKLDQIERKYHGPSQSSPETGRSPSLWDQ